MNTAVTSIKIIFPGSGTDREIDLTAPEVSALFGFLEKTTYGDVYKYVPNHGDGNARNSKSDIQTIKARTAVLMLVVALRAAGIQPPGRE